MRVEGTFLHTTNLIFVCPPVCHVVVVETLHTLAREVVPGCFLGRGSCAVKHYSRSVQVRVVYSVYEKTLCSHNDGLQVVSSSLRSLAETIFICHNLHHGHLSPAIARKAVILFYLSHPKSKPRLEELLQISHLSTAGIHVLSEHFIHTLTILPNKAALFYFVTRVEFSPKQYHS